MSISHLTIENVEKDFLSWRNKKNGHERIPEALWDKVKILLQSYRHSEVLRRLGLTIEQARRKNILSPKELHRHKPAPSQSSPFIKIPTGQTIMHAVAPQATTITLQRGDTQISLNCSSDAHLQLVINTIMR